MQEPLHLRLERNQAPAVTKQQDHRNVEVKGDQHLQQPGPRNPKLLCHALQTSWSISHAGAENCTTRPTRRNGADLHPSSTGSSTREHPCDGFFSKGPAGTACRRKALQPLAATGSRVPPRCRTIRRGPCRAVQTQQKHNSQTYPPQGLAAILDRGVQNT